MCTAAVCRSRAVIRRAVSAGVAVMWAVPWHLATHHSPQAWAPNPQVRSPCMGPNLSALHSAHRTLRQLTERTPLASPRRMCLRGDGAWLRAGLCRHMFVQLHMLLQVAATAMAAAGFFAIYQNKNNNGWDHFQSTHAYWGLLTLALMVMNLIAVSVLRPRPAQSSWDALTVAGCLNAPACQCHDGTLLRPPC